MFTLKGKYKLTHRRGGNVLGAYEIKNAVVTVGANALLDRMFNAAAASNWYIGIMASVTSLSASDTMSSHAGWTEQTNYTGNRYQWFTNAAGSRQITTNAAATLTFTSNANVTGVFLCSDTTKGGTAGILFSTASFGTISILNGDTLTIDYTLSVS